MPAIKKTVWLKEAKAGEKLAQDVYTRSGMLLVAKGAVLNPGIISRLMREGYETVVVKDESSAEQPIPAAPGEKPAPVSGFTDREVLTDTQFEELKKNLAGAKHIAEEVTRGRPIPLDVAHEIVKDVYEQIADKKDLYFSLQTLRTKDNYTFEHSLGVCIIATSLFKNSALTRDQLFEVSISALLHDIGKTRISDEILKKPGPLSDEEFAIIKQHPVIGYQIVMKDIGNEDIGAGVLQHHEREDCTGYPRGICSPNIHRYAKIINISDTFDAIVSDRVYREGSTPIKAFEEINRCLDKFDYSVYVNFIKQFSQFYIGSPITLNTGHKGYIAKIDIESPGRPLVRVGEHIYDLNKLRGLFITDLDIQKKVWSNIPKL